MAMIPEHDDLEFRVKGMARRDPPLKLNSSESALYIGSGPSLQTAQHMTSIVDSQHYILSDLQFPTTLTTQYGDCRITQTNQNGYLLLPKDSSIRFVMIDQAAEGDFETAYKAMQHGTFVYVHTIDATHTLMSRAYQERIGASFHLSRALFKKERAANTDDFKIANAVDEIVKNPLYTVPFFSGDPDLVFENGVRRRYFGNREDAHTKTMAQITAGIIIEDGRNNYRTNPADGLSDAEAERMVEQMFTQSLATISWEPNPDRVIADAVALRESLSSLLIILSPSEKADIKDVLETTSLGFTARPDKAYHATVKSIIDDCLQKLS